MPLEDSGTYWYHAHTTAWEQVARELYGPLVVQGRDDIEVDQELVLIMDDWRLDENAQIDEASFGNMHDWSHNGRLGVDSRLTEGCSLNFRSQEVVAYAYV